MIHDTGRIRGSLDRRAMKILFESGSERAIEDELPFYVQIDRAHIVMLVETGMLSREHARLLLTAINALLVCNYEPLRGRIPVRGTYLMYEQWLTETLGEAVGGAAHLGRSRNDINATIVRLRLRRFYLRLTRHVIRLLTEVTRRADQYGRLTMPIYTHHQPAVPITYGHYLTGIGQALLRDLRGLEDAVRDLDRCPLGAGAAGGTSVPIDTERTAQLLGFSEGVAHSVDAVASRDLVLRLLAAAAVLGVTLSRLSTDLQLWSTAEFALIRFPDELVGSSSMMPQKRNAFLLEHIKGRSGAPIGAFVSTTLAMHATPFSNSVAVGTEGVKHVWSALQELTDATVLARLVTAGAQPQPDTMRRRATDGFTSATELANRLVQATGMSFRQAHRLIGEAIRESSECGESLEGVAGRVFHSYGVVQEDLEIDPDTVASRAAHGGGPSAASVQRAVTALREDLLNALRRLKGRTRTWRDGARALDAAVASILSQYWYSDGETLASSAVIMPPTRP